MADVFNKVSAAKQAKEAFKSGDFKLASTLYRQICESDPGYTYLQMGDGEVRVVEKEAEGNMTDKRDPRSGEFVTKELA